MDRVRFEVVLDIVTGPNGETFIIESDEYFDTLEKKLLADLESNLEQSLVSGRLTQEQVDESKKSDAALITLQVAQSKKIHECARDKAVRQTFVLLKPQYKHRLAAKAKAMIVPGGMNEPRFDNDVYMYELLCNSVDGKNPAQVGEMDSTIAQRLAFEISKVNTPDPSVLAFM